MSRRTGPQIVSANDLLEGDVVYLDGSGTWTRDLGEAAVAHDEEAGQALLVSALAQQDRIVGPALIEISISAAGVRKPVHYRDIFRERGPSNRPDLVRQSEPRTSNDASAREADHVQV